MSHEKNIYQYVTESVCTCVDTLGVCLGAAAYLISLALSRIVNSRRLVIKHWKNKMDSLIKRYNIQNINSHSPLR